jgi:exopolysaccharide biosynthesis polyprenyl glycosylphosphotransferase
MTPPRNPPTAHKRRVPATLLQDLLPLGDLLVLLGAYALGYALRFRTPLLGPFAPGADEPRHYWYAGPAVAVVFFVTFKWLGLYRGRRFLNVVDEFQALWKGSFVALLGLSALAFFDREFAFSIKVFLLTAAFSLAGLLAWRTFMRWLQLRLRRQGVGVARTLLAGSGPTARRLAARLKGNPALGYRVLGFIDDLSPAKARAAAKALGLPCLGRLKGLTSAAKQCDADTLLIALPASLHQRDQSLILEAGTLGLDLRIVSDLYGVITSPLAVDDIHGIPVFSLREAPLDRRLNRWLKRSFDLGLTLAGLLLISPLLLLIAAAVKLSSPGPVFFRQARVGLGNRQFMMLKFRSMRADAEALGRWTVKDDPRRTPLGTFLRKTSLDELPQLFNVVKGDMSLVGPRPEQPAYVDRFSQDIHRYLNRHQVLPGITGWAQVHGWRGDTSIEERTAFDLYYVENWSLSLDLLILLKTGLELFEHETAY